MKKLGKTGSSEWGDDMSAKRSIGCYTSMVKEEKGNGAIRCIA